MPTGLGSRLDNTAKLIWLPLVQAVDIGAAQRRSTMTGPIFEPEKSFPLVFFLLSVLASQQTIPKPYIEELMFN